MAETLKPSTYAEKDRFPTLRKICMGMCVAYPLVILSSIAAANVLLILILLAWIILRPRMHFAAVKPSLYLVAAYLAWSLVAVIFSPYQSQYPAWFEERSTFLAILPGLILGSDYRLTRRSFRYVAIFLLVIAVYATLQYFTGWNWVKSQSLLKHLGHYRATGLQNSSLTFAGMMGLVIPVSAVAYPAWLLSSIISIFGSAAILASMARSIILAFHGGGILLVILGNRRLRLLGLIILIALLILPRTVFLASEDRLAREDESRLYLWRSALNIVQHHPVTGVGEGNWPVAFDRYGEPYDHYKSTAHAHSDVLTCMVENGIIGGMIFVALWGYVMLRLFISMLRDRTRRRELKLGFLISFSIILFGGLFQNYQTDAEVALLMWFMVGAAMQLTGEKN